MNKVRVANSILLIAMVVGAIVTYDMKYKAEVAAEGIDKLNASIAAEKDRIRSLNAEWSFLTQPSRLQAVVTEHADYFALKAFTPDQLAAIGEIPFKTATAAPGSTPIQPASANDVAVKATLARIAAGGALRDR
jgi:hypothetical protein